MVARGDANVGARFACDGAKRSAESRRLILAIDDRCLPCSDAPPRQWTNNHLCRLLPPLGKQGEFNSCYEQENNSGGSTTSWDWC